jgi:hypothetical protein
VAAHAEPSWFRGSPRWRQLARPMLVTAVDSSATRAMQNRTRPCISPMLCAFLHPTDGKASMPAARWARCALLQATHTARPSLAQSGENAATLAYTTSGFGTVPPAGPILPAPRRVRRRSGSTARTARINQHPQRSGGRARDRAQPRCPMSRSSSDTASVRWRAPEWRTRRPDRSAQFGEHGMACRRGETSRSRARRKHLMTSRDLSLR